MALDQAKFHWNSSKRKRIDGPFSQSVSHGKFGQYDLNLSSSIMNMVKNSFFQCTWFSLNDVTINVTTIAYVTFILVQI